MKSMFYGAAFLALAATLSAASAQSALDRQMNSIEAAVQAGSPKAPKATASAGKKMPEPAQEAARTPQAHNWTGAYVGVSGGVVGARASVSTGALGVPGSGAPVR